MIPFLPWNSFSFNDTVESMGNDLGLFNEEKNEFLQNAQLVSNKGYVCNQLGNIAIRKKLNVHDEDLVLTKHKGPSLEIMTRANVVAVGLESDQLYCGSIRPSIGHQLNRQILLHRKEVNAVIHLHVDEVIAYFSLFYKEKFNYISADAAIILGSPVKILPPEINVEINAEEAYKYIATTNVLILANHGVSTFGDCFFQAFQRLNTLIAEIRRIALARQLALSSGVSIRYIDRNEEESLYELSKEIL